MPMRRLVSQVLRLRSMNIKEFRLNIPRWEELPDIGLYMDQVVSYVLTVIKPVFEDGVSAALTPNMVNNYVKAKLVDAPIGKKYGRLAIAMIIVVCVLKVCYTTEEINKLISTSLGLGTKPNVLYNRFCRAIEGAVESVFSGNISLSDASLPDRRLKYLMGNFALSFACKFYVKKRFLQA